MIADTARDPGKAATPHRRTASGTALGAHVIFHTLDQAVAALTAADRARASVCLRTARGAVRYAGPSYLLGIVRLAIIETGSAYDIDASAIDCRDEPALAFAALRAGWRTIIYTGPSPYRDEVRAAVARYSGTLISRPPRTLDLLDVTEPYQACLKWYAR